MIFRTKHHSGAGGQIDLQHAVAAEIAGGAVDMAEAAEGGVVGVEQQYVFACRTAHGIVGVGVRGAEVEEEDAAVALEGEHLPVDVAHERVRRDSQCAGGSQRRHHGTMELVEELILERSVLHQRPLAAGVMIRPAVALAGEVYPLGMAKFITHKIQETAVTKRCRTEVYHLVQRNAPIHRQVGSKHRHAGVHLRTYQSENPVGEAGVNIRTIAQGADELAIVIGVEEEDYETAIRVMYDGFAG